MALFRTFLAFSPSAGWRALPWGVCCDCLCLPRPFSRCWCDVSFPFSWLLQRGQLPSFLSMAGSLTFQCGQPLHFSPVRLAPSLPLCDPLAPSLPSSGWPASYFLSVPSCLTSFEFCSNVLFSVKPPDTHSIYNCTNHPPSSFSYFILIFSIELITFNMLYNLFSVSCQDNGFHGSKDFCFFHSLSSA